MTGFRKSVAVAVEAVAVVDPPLLHQLQPEVRLHLRVRLVANRPRHEPRQRGALAVGGGQDGLHVRGDRLARGERKRGGDRLAEDPGRA